jgi:DNA helicase HerA-like ATPase
MAPPLLIAKNDRTELSLLPGLANRHGLITGATGTGKTFTLQALAQRFSSIGVPVFMAEVKGDLSDLAKPGGQAPKVAERLQRLKARVAFEACPVAFWDVYGKSGLTPKDQKALKTAADTLRPNPKLNAERVITELEVGEALVSFLDEKGRPTMVERAFIVPPGSQIGPLDDDGRKRIIESSPLFGHYEKAIDRESAYEKLKSRTDPKTESSPVSDALFGKVGPRGGKQSQGILEAMTKSAARAIGSELGRQVLRGVLGSILGGGRRR